MWVEEGERATRDVMGPGKLTDDSGSAEGPGDSSVEPLRGDTCTCFSKGRGSPWSSTGVGKNTAGESDGSTWEVTEQSPRAELRGKDLVASSVTIGSQALGSPFWSSVPLTCEVRAFGSVLGSFQNQA